MVPIRSYTFHFCFVSAYVAGKKGGKKQPGTSLWDIAAVTIVTVAVVTIVAVVIVTTVAVVIVTTVAVVTVPLLL